MLRLGFVTANHPVSQLPEVHHVTDVRHIGTSHIPEVHTDKEQNELTGRKFTDVVSHADEKSSCSEMVAPPSVLLKTIVNKCHRIPPSD